MQIEARISFIWCLALLVNITNGLRLSLSGCSLLISIGLEVRMDEHKYDPLYDFLKEFKGNLTISFEDVARIIGCDELPDYAYNSKGSWWYIGDRHVQAEAWAKAGYKADPDFNKQEVTFTKMK